MRQQAAARGEGEEGGRGSPCQGSARLWSTAPPPDPLSAAIAGSSGRHKHAQWTCGWARRLCAQTQSNDIVRYDVTRVQYHDQGRNNIAAPCEHTLHAPHAQGATLRGWTWHGLNSGQYKQAWSPMGRLPYKAPFPSHAAPRRRRCPSAA